MQSETMKERIPAIIFYATGESHWKSVLKHTLAGAFGATPGEEFRVLSYVCDWRDAFAESDWLDADLCNINNLLEFRTGLRKLREYPLAVILHSAAWDRLTLLRWAAGHFQDRRGKLILFIGNEYNTMSEKIAFATSVAADYIATQLPLKAAEWLYADCQESRVLLAPPALNAKLYRPGLQPRSIDIGFRGEIYAHLYSLGDTERADILRFFDEQSARWGLGADIQYVRRPREEWSSFLGRCKATVGAESGTYYLERDDRTQETVKQYMVEHPKTTFQNVYDRFFKDYSNPVSGKAISSRHFEPVGTKTCQILLEGHYNGILKPDEHYLSLKKDYSNIEDVLRRFKDEEYRTGMVERTYEYVMAKHTYGHRIESLLRAVLEDRVAA